MSPITDCLVQFSIGIMCIIVFVYLFAFFHKNLAALLLVGKHYGHSTHWLLVKLIDWDHVHYCVCLSVLFLFVRLFFLKNAEELLVDGEYVRHTPAPRCRSRSGS